MPRKLAKSFLHAFDGLRFVWQDERNFRIETYLSVGTMVVLALLGFAVWELALVLLAITALLSSEIVNTAIENLCDQVDPAYNNHIGRIKDMCAAFVLICALAAAAVVTGIVIAHYFS